MTPLWRSVTVLQAGADVLRARRYGTIEAVDGQLREIVLRPLPKIVSVPKIMWFGHPFHRRRQEDRCLLYYDQPWAFPNYLAIKYFVSGSKTRLATVYAALRTLEEIARLKRSDAILCDVANYRLSDRVMARWGYVPHCPSRWHRHFIKRFYGVYPARDVSGPVD